MANARKTRMDDFADDTILYDSGLAAEAMNNLKSDNGDVASKLADAENLIVITGAEGLKPGKQSGFDAGCCEFPD